jgi:uncharacterized protein (TIGR02145 family)
MRKIVRNYLKLFLTIIILLAGCSDSITEPEETAAQDPVLPHVLTAGILKIEHQRAFGEGKVMWDGGSTVTARGFVWSLEPEPTLADNKTLDGDGFGEFVSLMAELQPDKTYYARAYATNSVGTAYGADEVFKTRYGSVTDIDGNEYFTVRIGNRLWMSENLRVTHYANGDPIPTGLFDGSWQNAGYGAYAIYPHNLIPGLASDEKVIEAYGLIYNWFVAADPRGVCPTGWRVPDNIDWGHLASSLGGSSVAGRSIKSKRTDPAPHPRWAFPNEATNESGWSALPGGRRLFDGSCTQIGTHSHWLSATERDSLHSWSRYLYYNSPQLHTNYSYKQNGNYIRCVKNAGSN